MTTANGSPFYLRFGITLLSIAILGAGIYLSQAILVPFLFSILLATILLPFTKFLQDRGVPKVWSIGIPLILTLSLVGVIVYFLSTQIANFLADIPALERKFNELLWEVQKWVNHQFHVSMRDQREYLEQTTEKMKDGTPAVIGRTFVTITELVSYVIFLPIYTFLILYHKDMIKQFLLQICKDGDEHKVRDILYESQSMSQQYIIGLMIELTLVFVMNTIGFLILGIKYPVFLALISAFLNIVPYIGMLVANLFSIVVTLMSSDQFSDAIWVAVVLGAVQVVDNNILMPLIVGNKVRLNALAIILGVLIGGALAGIAGMFLTIPALAVIKIIFERVEHLRPWSMLLGDETTLEEEDKNPVKRTFMRVRARSRAKQRKGIAKQTE